MSKVQSVERALRILEILTNETNGIGVTDLSYRLDIAKSTTHRILNTLLEYNYVRRDLVTERYLLGSQILLISNYVLENFNIREVAKKKIEELSKVTNEAVHLCVHDKGEVVYIDKVESTHTIRMHSKIGMRGLMHCTGVGKAILAFLNEQEVENILLKKGMPSYTKNTIKSIEKMRDELQRVRHNGYSIDDVENEKGIRCIAAPIFDHNQKPIAAISISGPETRITHDRIQNELIEIIKDFAKQISKYLGAK